MGIQYTRAQLEAAEKNLPADVVASYKKQLHAAADDVVGFDPTLGRSNERDLEGPSKILDPHFFPMFRDLPRSPNQTEQSKWKVADNIRTDGLISVDRNTAAAGPNLVQDGTDVTADIRRFALQYNIVDSAQSFSKGYEDHRMTGDIMSMILFQEEMDFMYWGGRGAGSAAIGTPTGFSSSVSGGGSLVAGTYTFRVTALTSQGWKLSEQEGYLGFDSGFSPLFRNGEGAVGESAGIAILLNEQVDVFWDAVDDAVAYNVYVKIDAGAYEWIETVSLTTVNLSAPPSLSGNLPPAADASVDTNGFNGIIQQLRSLGAPVFKRGRNPLTPTAKSINVEQWVDAFRQVARSDKTGPTVGWVPFEIAGSLVDIVGGSALRINLEAGTNEFRGGVIMTELMNPVTKELVKIKTHPNFPKGITIFWRETNPYDHDRLDGASIDVKVNRELFSTQFDKQDYSENFGLSVLETGPRVRSALGAFVELDVGAT